MKADMRRIIATQQQEVVSIKRQLVERREKIAEWEGDIVNLTDKLENETAVLSILEEADMKGDK